VILPDTFRGMGAERKSVETQQSFNLPRSRPDIKTEEIVPKKARRRGSAVEDPEEGELNPAVDIRRCWKEKLTIRIILHGKSTSRKPPCDETIHLLYFPTRLNLKTER